MTIKDLKDFSCGGLISLFGKRAVWLGSAPPFIADAVEITSPPNFRLPASLHGNYAVVWLYEVELFGHGAAWPLILDESIRLLGETGYLVVRTRDSGFGTIFEVKSILARNPNLAVKLSQQETLEDGSTVMVFDVVRNDFPAYRDTSWTIGILSNGKKSENVLDLIKKFSEISSSRKIEFLVAGPPFPYPEMQDANIRFLPDNYSDALPRISEKKRAIVDNSAHANIAIFHDRYQINADFFSGFDLFGYDYDYVSIIQRYESGNYYPSYVGFLRRELRWQKTVFNPDYSMLHDGHYVNGGLIIIKRHTARAISFNHLLLHNEAEDVELGFIMRDHGIPPRMNIHSSAFTVGVSENYTSTFQEIACKRKDSWQNTARRLAQAVWLALPESLQVRLRYSRLYVFAEKLLYPH